MWNEFPLVFPKKVDGILNLCVSSIALVCFFFRHKNKNSGAYTLFRTTLSSKENTYLISYFTAWF